MGRRTKQCKARIDNLKGRREPVAEEEPHVSDDEDLNSSLDDRVSTISVESTDSDDDENMEREELTIDTQKATDFLHRLWKGQADWIAQLKARARPVKYSTIPSKQAARTQRFHKLKTARETSRLRGAGFPDIRQFFHQESKTKSKHQQSEEVVIDQGTNTRTEDTLSPPSPIAFTEEQVAALRAQIQAFQLIQQGVPIPEHIQAALLPRNNAIANLEEAHLVLAEPAVGEESCCHGIAENIMFGRTSTTDRDAFDIALHEKDDCHGIAENIMFGQTATTGASTFNVAPHEKDDCHGIAENIMFGQTAESTGSRVLDVPAQEGDACHGIAENIMFGQTATTGASTFNVAPHEKDDCHGIAENVMIGQTATTGASTFNVAPHEKDDCHGIAENVMIGQTATTGASTFNVAPHEKDDCHGTAENVVLGQFTPLDTRTFNVALDMDMLKDVIAGTAVKSMGGVFGECRREGPTPMPRRVESEIGEACISSSGGNTLHTFMNGDPTTIPPPRLSFPAAVNSAVTVEMATFESPSSSDPPPPEKESKYTAPKQKH
ncbi:SNF21_3 [Sanghuangporus vaninii]